MLKAKKLRVEDALHATKVKSLLDDAKAGSPESPHLSTAYSGHLLPSMPISNSHNNLTPILIKGPSFQSLQTRVQHLKKKANHQRNEQFQTEMLLRAEEMHGSYKKLLEEQKKEGEALMLASKSLSTQIWQSLLVSHLIYTTRFGSGIRIS
ncbi:hypothetical protein C5167_008212 [Papaver somniferum]|uniref:Uncharacterized protein n=1 Tax=Papaver somniferum TaxID=3469 RepID=A0A4Y7JWU0_PAPSO|nr:hypothetical protein C5167_008212 [Papaver somniferum]